MARSLMRALAVVAGIVLGMALVSGVVPWRELFGKPDEKPSAPIQRERAPDTRV